VRIESRELQVELDEFRIVPEDVSVASGRLRVVATNVGRLTHNLKIVKEDEEDREAPPTEIGGTGTAQPGETATFTFDDLRPGEYRIVCTITNHDDLGQYGELIVREEGE
jgi:plastocyanin